MRTIIPALTRAYSVNRGRGRDDRRDGLPARHRREIVEKKADYILALKGNQGTLHEDVEVRDEQKALKYKNTMIRTHEMVDADHGRIETRNSTMSTGAGAPRMAQSERRRSGRKPTRNQWQDHERDPLLHHSLLAHDTEESCVIPGDLHWSRPEAK
jgi:hypothetical protein